MQVKCKTGGQPKQTLSVELEPLPKELEWGEVLVSIRYAPINPADLYTCMTGGWYGNETIKAPFIAGHDGIGVVMKVTTVDLMPNK